MNSQRVLNISKRLIPTSLLPFVRRCWIFIFHREIYHTIKEIQRYYKSKSIENEISEVLSGINDFGIRPFPYPWAEYPKKIPVNVLYDDKLNLPYVYLDNKRLYYPRDMSPEQIRKYHYSVQMIEQHPSSPHRYLIDTFNVSDMDIVADCGVAEGNFGLAVVDRVRKLYLFEPEEKWIESLHATFSPWKDKVEIVQTYLSDSTGDSIMSCTIDTYFSDKEIPTFLKLDVEGHEGRVLSGAIKCIESGNVKKIVSCVYHYADDEKMIGDFLCNHGYSITPSRGYMAFSMFDELKPPYFRRGLLRGTK